MAFETRFDISPYFDDYNRSDQFLKILFRPGFAVQTRELNQLQTIVQDQIARLGNHVFKNGSVVTGGQISIRNSYPYLKLETNYVDSNGNQQGSIGDEIENRIGETVTIRDSNIDLKALIINATAPTNDDPATLFLEYKEGDENRASGTFEDNDQLNFSEYGNDVVVTESGIGSAVDVQKGVYYVDGYFHFVPSQTIILDKYNDKPTYSIGFKIQTDLVTPEDQEQLLDNAGGSPNFGAPGAHRFRVQLNLEKRELSSVQQGLLVDEEEFLQLVRIEEGRVQNIARNSSYNELDNKLAARTYDESGNYVISPFSLSKRPHLKNNNNGVFTSAEGGDADKFTSLVDGGKAYVYGYRIQKHGTTVLEHDKARTSDHVKSAQAVSTPARIGAYVLAEFASDSGFPQLGDQVDIRDAWSSDINLNGNIIGTCRIRHIEVDNRIDGTTYRIYVYDIQMGRKAGLTSITNGPFQNGETIIDQNNGASATVLSFDINNDIIYYQLDKNSEHIFTGHTIEGQNSGATADVNSVGTTSFSLDAEAFSTPTGTLEGMDANIIDSTLKEQSNNKFLFELPQPVINNITSILYVTSETLDEESGNTGNKVTFQLPSGEVFREPFFLFNRTSGGVFDIATTTAVTISSGGFGQSTVTFDGVDNDSEFRLVARVQHTTSNSRTKEIQTAQETVSRSTLINNGRVTLSQADVIAIDSVETDAGTAITDSFKFDTGQRDNIYDYGQLILKQGETIPEEGTNPDAVTVQYQYFSHTQGDYLSVNSYSVDLDRIPSYRTSDGQTIRLFEAIDFRPKITDPSSFSGHASPDSIIIADVDFFVGRIDNVVLNTKGRILLQRGLPAREPKAPSNKSDSIVLHRVSVPPFTFNIEDIDVDTLEHKHFTMTDIANIEERVSDLEEEAVLNKLEQDADTLNVGRNTNDQGRFKNGFIVDPFFDHTVGRTDSPDYSISVDFTEQEARPQPFTETVDLDILDQASLDSIVYHDNNIITLPYTEKFIVSQEQATDTVSVNPFMTFHWRGEIKLDPESDIWFDTERLPDVINREVTETRAFQRAEATNSFGTEWDNWQTQWFGEGEDRERRRTRTGVRREATTTVRERVNDRIVSRVAIPFIRSRTVEVNAQGLRPNSRHYAFFDGVNVTNNVTQTSSPASTGSWLLTDENGELTAEFEIPNNDEQRFRTGTRDFMLVGDNEIKPDNVSQAVAEYHAEGTLRTRQTTIESVRVRDVETETVSQTEDVPSFTPEPTQPQTAFTALQTGFWIDPVAQSFMVNQESGSFVTGIDVSFTRKDDTKPVQCSIVPTENGFPSRERVPMASVTLRPDQVNASESTFEWTTFTFPAPIYLQEGAEYAFIIQSTSDDYVIRYATMGERDIRTGTAIAKQPYNGVMFKSANSSTWESMQSSDLTFRLRTAVFSPTTATIEADTVVPSTERGTDKDPFKQKLGKNPISTRKGSSWILVRQHNHGFSEGDIVRFSGIVGNEQNQTQLNGFLVGPSTNPGVFTLNGFDHQVRFPQKDFYFIQHTGGSQASSDGSGGGDNVLADRQLPYDVVFPVVQQQLPGDTNITWDLDPRGFVSRTAENISAIDVNEDNALDKTMVLLEENDSVSRLTAKLSTSTPNLSPVIDAERLGLTLTRNRINDTASFEDEAETNPVPPYSDYDLFVPETDNESSAIAKYVTEVINLNNDSNSLQVKMDIHQPVDYARVRVFYRLQLPDDDDPLGDKQWNVLPRVTPDRVSSNPNDFFEITFDSANIDQADWAISPSDVSSDPNLDPGDEQELPDYQAVQIKVVMDYQDAPNNGADTTAVPRLKRFRALALAT